VPDEETQKDRLNRNLDQLLQELRVAIPGVQVLFAFLLAVPFSTRFNRVDQFERVIFFIALVFAAVSVVLLMAPSIQHRILFRHDEKHFLVHAGTNFAIAGMTALAVAMTLSLVLVAHFLYGIWAAVIAAAAAFAAFASIWYAIPIDRRRHAGPARDDP
jgi:FtsH-binding integral membrane protein